jgi:hypothetical protein
LERVTIPIAGLPPALEGLRIVQMSDLHLHPYTQIGLIEQAVDLANRLEPDLVALTGDYVLSSGASILELAPVLGRLRARLGVFAVLGNHDMWKGPRTITQELEQAGITVFANAGRALQIERGDERGTLYLAGLSDGLTGHPDLRHALRDMPSNATCILLMHVPDVADEYAADGRVALQLSGHSHGGQVRLPGRGALILPPMGVKYDHGLYRVGDMWLYTNRGIGVTGPPVRFNCRPEVTQITLTTTSHDI